MGEFNYYVHRGYVLRLLGTLWVVAEKRFPHARMFPLAVMHRRGLREGGENCVKYFKRGWKKKREGKTKILRTEVSWVKGWMPYKEGRGPSYELCLSKTLLQFTSIFSLKSVITIPKLQLYFTLIHITHWCFR